MMRYSFKLACLASAVLAGCGGGDGSGSGTTPPVALPPTGGPSPAPTPGPAPTPTPSPGRPAIPDIASVSYIHRFGVGVGDGSQPNGPLLVANDGNLYGTTRVGGGNRCVGNDNFCGVVFRISPSGVMTVMHRFTGDPDDGAQPTGPLIQGQDGALYGLTTIGGRFGRGVAFRLALDGAYSILHSFGQTKLSGDRPSGALLEASDGLFYGTTFGGGEHDCSRFSDDCGTLFSISSAGVHTVRYSFGATSTDGAIPNGSLTQASDGSFYGTTVSGGNVDCVPFNQSNLRGCGTIFRFTASGGMTTLHAFGATDSDGRMPFGPVTRGPDGNYYGTTAGGGNRICGGVTVGCGLVFRMTPQGMLSVVYRFATPLADGVYTNEDGYNPGPNLYIDTNGDIYGITESGGRNVQTARTGTVFRLTSSGTKTTLYSFGPFREAPMEPVGGLVRTPDGAFYGVTAYSEDPLAAGTVFKMLLP